MWKNQERPKLTMIPTSTGDKVYHEIPLSVGDCTVRQKKNRVINNKQIHMKFKETQWHCRYRCELCNTVILGQKVKALP